MEIVFITKLHPFSASTLAITFAVTFTTSTCSASLVTAFVRKLITSAFGVTWECRPRLSSGSSKDNGDCTSTVVRLAVPLNQMWDAHPARMTLVTIIVQTKNSAVRPLMIIRQTGGLVARNKHVI